MRNLQGTYGTPRMDGSPRMNDFKADMRSSSFDNLEKSNTGMLSSYSSLACTPSRNLGFANTWPAVVEEFPLYNSRSHTAVEE
jgi:hypothetical protein